MGYYDNVDLSNYNSSAPRISTQEPIAVDPSLAPSDPGTLEQATPQDTALSVARERSAGEAILRAPRDYIAGTWYGATAQVPGIMGRAIEYAGEETGSPGVSKVGKGIADWAKKREEENVAPEVRESYAYQAGSFMGLPVISAPYSLANWGMRAASAAGKLAKAKRAVSIADKTDITATGLKLAEDAQKVGIAERLLPFTTAAQPALNVATHAVPGAAFFGSTAQEVKERAKAAGVDPGMAPEAEGALMSAGLMITNALLLRTFKGLAPKLPTDAEGKIIIEGMQKSLEKGAIPKDVDIKTAFRLKTAQDMLYDYIKTVVPASTASMFAVTVANSAIDKEQGIRPDADPLMEGLEMMIPLLGMHLVTGPMSALGGYVNGNRKLNEVKKYFKKVTEEVKAEQEKKVTDSTQPKVESKKIEVYDDITGRYKETIEEKELVQAPELTSAQKEKILSLADKNTALVDIPGKASFAVTPQNIRSGDIVLDSAGNEHKVKTSREGKIITERETKPEEPKNFTDILGLVPEADRDSALKASQYIALQYEFNKRNPGKGNKDNVIIDGAAKVAPTVSPNILSDMARNIKLKIVGRTAEERGLQTVVFDPNDIRYKNPKAGEGTKVKQITETELSNKGLDTREKLLAAVSDLQANGYRAGEAFLGVLSDPNKLDRLISSINPEVRETLKLEKGAEPSLQDQLRERTKGFIDLSRVPRVEFSETGKTTLEFLREYKNIKDENRVIADTAAELESKLKDLNDTQIRKGRQPTFVIAPHPEQEGRFGIARQRPEYQKEVKAGRGFTEPEIKAAALEKIEHHLRTDKDLAGRDDAFIKTLSSKIFEDALGDANKTSKEWKAEVDKVADLGEAETLVRQALTSAAGRAGGWRELDKLVKMYREKRAKAPKYTAGQKVEAILYAMGVNPETMQIKGVQESYADLIHMAKLRPELLRDFVGNKSAIAMQAEKKAKDIRTGEAKKKKQNENEFMYWKIYKSTLSTKISKALGKEIKGSAAEMKAAAKKAGLKDEQINRYVASAMEWAEKQTGWKPPVREGEEAKVAARAEKKVKYDKKAEKKETKLNPKEWTEVDKGKSFATQKEGVLYANEKYPTGSIHKGKIIAERLYEKETKRLHLRLVEPGKPDAEGWIEVIAAKDKAEATTIRDKFYVVGSGTPFGGEVLARKIEGNKLKIKVGEKIEKPRPEDFLGEEDYVDVDASKLSDKVSVKKLKGYTSIPLDKTQPIEAQLEKVSEQYPYGKLIDGKFVADRRYIEGVGVKIKLEAPKIDKKTGRAIVPVQHEKDATVNRKKADAMSALSKWYTDKKYDAKIDDNGVLTIKLKEVIEHGKKEGKEEKEGLLKDKRKKSAQEITEATDAAIKKMSRELLEKKVAELEAAKKKKKEPVPKGISSAERVATVMQHFRVSEAEARDIIILNSLTGDYKSSTVLRAALQAIAPAKKSTKKKDTSDTVLRAALTVVTETKKSVINSPNASLTAIARRLLGIGEKKAVTAEGKAQINSMIETILKKFPDAKNLTLNNATIDTVIAKIEKDKGELASRISELNEDVRKGETLKASISELLADAILDEPSEPAALTVIAKNRKGKLKTAAEEDTAAGGLYREGEKAGEVKTRKGGDILSAAIIGKNEYLKAPTSTFHEWILRCREFVGNTWNAIKDHMSYVWNRLKNPRPVIQEGTEGTYYSAKDSGKSGYELDTEMIKKFNSMLRNDKTLDEHQRRLIRNFPTRLLARVDTRSKPSEFMPEGEADLLFDATMLEFNGRKKFGRYTAAEIERVRDYRRQISQIYYGGVKSRGKVGEFKEKLSKIFKNTKELNDVVWSTLSPLDYDAGMLAEIKRMVTTGADKNGVRPMSEHWSMRKDYMYDEPYYMREVTPIVRKLLLNNEKGTVSGARNRFTDEVTVQYKNGLQTIRTGGKEYLCLDHEQLFNDENTRKQIRAVDFAEASAKPFGEKLGVFSAIGAHNIDTMNALAERRILTPEYIQKRVPGSMVKDMEDALHITLPNGFEFKLIQSPVERVEIITKDEFGRKIKVERDVLGRWEAGGFLDSWIKVANDIKEGKAKLTFEHELFHLVVDTQLTRAEQKELLSLYKKPGDKLDMDAWERAASDFETYQDLRTTLNPFKKIVLGIEKLSNWFNKLFGREEHLSRDNIFESLRDSSIFDRRVQANRAQFPEEAAILWSTIDLENMKVDPNWNMKRTWLDEYKQDSGIYKVMEEVSGRDAEHAFYHNPNLYRKILDLWKEKAGRKEYHKSGEQVGRIEHWLSTPFALAAAKIRDAEGKLTDKYPHWRRAVDIAQEWEQVKAESVYKYRAEDTPTLQQLKPHETRIFDSLSEWSTANRHYFTEAELRDKTKMKKILNELDPELKDTSLTEDTIKGYLEQATNMKEKMLPLLKRFQEEALIKPYSIKSVMDPGQYAKLVQMYRDQMAGKPLHAYEMKALKKSDPVVYDAFNKLKASLTELRIKRNKMGFGLEGFFPVRRNQTDYYMNVYRVRSNPKYNPNRKGSAPEIFETAYTFHPETAGATYRVEQYWKNKLKTDPFFSSDPNVKYTTRGGRAQTIEEAGYFMVGDLNTERIIDVAIGRLQAEKKITPEIAAEMSNKVLSAIADSMRARGSMQTAIQRKFLSWEKGNPLIGGYIRKGQREVQNNYVAGLYGIQNKLHASQKFMEVIHDVPKDMKQTAVDMSEYATDVLRNLDKYDRMVGKAKHIAFNMYLLGKASFAVLQMTQNFVTGMPVLAAEMRAMGFSKGIGGAERIYTTAMKDVGFAANEKTKHLANLTPEEAAFLEHIHRMGVTLPQTAMDLGIEAAATGDKMILKAMRVMQWPVLATETFNRKSAALAMYRALKEAEAQKKVKLSPEEFDRKISDYINSTHYWMGRGNSPAVARGAGGTGKAGNLFYTFGRFWHNYANTLWYGFQNYGGLGGAMMAARSMAMLVAIGGVPALPFIDEFLDLAERKTGKAFRSDARRYVKRLFGQTALTQYDAGIIGHVLGDMSAGIRPLRVPFTNNASESLLGVYYGLGNKMIKSGNALIQGDIEKAAAHASPAFAENFAKAVIERERGWRDNKNRPLYDEQGNIIKLTPKESILYGLGFKPYRTSQLQEERRVLSNVTEAWRAKAEDIRERQRLAKTNSQILDVQNRITRYNLDRPKEYEQVIPRISYYLEEKAPKKWMQFQNR